MISTVVHENLESLSVAELAEAARGKVGRERRVVCQFVLLLVEVDRRQVYRDLGFPSMFHWLTRGLGLSESSASKRIQVARVIVRLPSIRDRVVAMIVSGDMHLAGLSLLSSHLTEENAVDILESAKGLTRQQMESLIASRFAEKVAPVKSWIRIVDPGGPGERCVPGDPQPWPSPPHPAESAPAKDDQRSRCDGLRQAGPTQPGLAIRLAVTLVGDGAKDLLRLRELSPWRDPGQIIHEALALLRRARDLSSARLPRAVQRQVFARDGNQCAFVSDDGVRCPARGRLQIDHILPRAKGGDDEIGNLRLLCAAHNQLMAERHFGREFMREKIRARQDPDA